MDSPIDPVNKGSEYVGLPKVDPWHESEKHRKKRFAKMLEDRLEEQKKGSDEEDAVELSGGGEESSDNSPETPTDKKSEAKSDQKPAPPATHIDLKG
jgi:hypothetical protein